MSDYLAYLREISPDASFRRKIGYFQHNFKRFLPLADPERLSVLEIGPGLGEFVAFLSGKGVRTIDIVDNDPPVLEHLKANFAVRNAYLADDVSSLASSLGQYDVIVLTQVLEHLKIPDCRPFIQALYRHLKVGGVIIITVPNGANPLNMGERYSDITHCTLFTENSLKQLVNLCGLPAAEATVQGYEIPPTFPINILRIILQKTLHAAIRLLLILNGGVTSKILTPNLTLILRKNPGDGAVRAADR